MRIELRHTSPRDYEILINGERRTTITKNHNESDIELGLRANRVFDEWVDICKAHSKFEERTVKLVTI